LIDIYLKTNSNKY